MTESKWVGVDVSKSHLDVFASGKHRRFRIQDELEACVTWVVSTKPEGVVVEATGGYEQQLVVPLQARKQEVSVVNPSRVRAFAKSAGRLAKTDKLDAKLLADFGAAMKPRPSPPVSAPLRELRDVLTLRQQLTELCKMTKQYREHTNHGEMLSKLEALTAHLTKEIDELERLASKVIAESAPLAAKSKRLQTMPGIGPIISAILLAFMPELGTLDRGKISALAGLAPMNRDSGSKIGHAHICGGRPLVRMMLFLAAISNQRHRSSPYKDSFRAHRERGKAAKTAAVATARRILCGLNAMLKTETDFSPDKAKSLQSAA